MLDRLLLLFFFLRFFFACLVRGPNLMFFVTKRKICHLLDSIFVNCDEKVPQIAQWKNWFSVFKKKMDVFGWKSHFYNLLGPDGL